MANGDGAALAGYHEATKHSVASVQRGRHGLDWDIMPRPFKVYPELAGMPLPQDLHGSQRPALEAIAASGAAAGPGPALDRAALARLLYFTAGILRRRTWPGGEIHFRAAACTGALYHVDLYVVTAALPDLDAGVYHFGPHDFSLTPLRTGDHRAVLAAASGDEPAVAGAPAVVVAASTYWRNAWKYQARAYRHCWWDAGTMLANLIAVAAAAGLPAHVVLGFVDADVARLLDLDPEREAPLALVALGRGGPPAPPRTPVEPLGLATLPPSSREVDYPAIRAAHAASSLDTPDAVAAWRGPLAPAAFLPAPGPVVPLPDAPPPIAPEAVERVILRRGSTRRFDPRAAIRFDAFATLLRTATRGIAGDVLAPGAALTAPYVLAHAVDGLAPGAWAFDRARDALVGLRAGTFRREAAHLGLGQALPGEAAACIFWLADLRRVFARYGDRGYRAAQLEGAIEGGRAYLAAYALGLGATGLTFFDDDVTSFFAPHGAEQAVMFLLAVGAPRRRT
jgi:SagB-type dehydrogenase family enzyme